MDVDVAQLAQALMPYLTAAMPYLASAGEKAAEAVGEKAGEELASGALEKAKTLWGKVGSKVRKKPEAAAAAAAVAESPGDPEAESVLRAQLEEILREDEALAAAIARVLEDVEPKHAFRAEIHGDGVIAQGPGAVAAGQVAVSGDVHGDVVVGGGPRRAREKVEVGGDDRIRTGE